MAAEAWRQKEVDTLYANMTDEDWATGARWKQYAEPDAPERTCATGAPLQLDDMRTLLDVVASISTLSNSSRVKYLALHAFHTTGLEGNTLTLPETLLTVAGKSLLAGFDRRVLPTPVTQTSTIEARNVAQLWDALDLASLPGRRTPPLDIASAGLQGLVDMNSAITRDTGVPFGLRRRAVAIGHKRVLLPMPDELPALMRDFFEWLAAALVRAGPASALGLDGGGTAPEALRRALDLACDVHTRFVFTHPFADGNGRVARTLAGIILQRFGLPAPMFSRDLRSEYMAAVSSATIDRNYTTLSEMHAAAVRRSLACIIVLAEADGAVLRPVDAAVRGLVDSECNMTGI